MRPKDFRQLYIQAFLNASFLLFFVIADTNVLRSTGNKVSIGNIESWPINLMIHVTRKLI
ncbi:MAG: hypothetical protein CK424_03080 [Legionella sp.]|nr:MAG: hypothetical protein CK424_03080 [Legionella sp.]